jgi:hypothetical protein
MSKIDTKFKIERVEQQDINCNYVIRRSAKNGTEYLTNQLKVVVLKHLYLDNFNVFFADKSTCTNVLYCYNNNLPLDIPTTNHCWDWSDEDEHNKYDNLCPWLENDGGDFYCNLGFTYDKLKEEGNAIVKCNNCGTKYNGLLD